MLKIKTLKVDLFDLPFHKFILDISVVKPFLVKLSANIAGDLDLEHTKLRTIK